MRTYRILASPDIRLAAHGLPPLTWEGLTGALGEMVVRDLREADLGRIELEVQLDGRDRAQALDEVEVALRRLGLALVEATVRDWVGTMATRALVGALGGAAVGGITKNFAVGLIASGIGIIAASMAGDQARELLAQYDARRNRHGAWVFDELPLPQPSHT